MIESNKWASIGSASLLLGREACLLGIRYIIPRSGNPKAEENRWHGFDEFPARLALESGGTRERGGTARANRRAPRSARLFLHLAFRPPAAACVSAILASVPSTVSNGGRLLFAKR